MIVQLTKCCIRKPNTKRNFLTTQFACKYVSSGIPLFVVGVSSRDYSPYLLHIYTIHGFHILFMYSKRNSTQTSRKPTGHVKKSVEEHRVENMVKEESVEEIIISYCMTCNIHYQSNAWRAALYCIVLRCWDYFVFFLCRLFVGWKTLLADYFMFACKLNHTNWPTLIFTSNHVRVLWQKNIVILCSFYQYYT